MIDEGLLTSPIMLAEAIFESILEVYAAGCTKQAFMTLPPVDMVKNSVFADAVEVLLNRFNIEIPEEIYRRTRTGVQEKFIFQAALTVRDMGPRSVVLNCSPLARNLVITGEPPIDGEDGKVVPYFDHDFMPDRLLPDGSKVVDFKEIQRAPQTAGNELLLHIYMSTKGTPGTDIFGAPILAKGGTPCIVKLGEGIVEKPCLSQEPRPCKAIYSTAHGIIIAEFRDGIRRPSNIRRISILNKIELLPIDLTGANINNPDELKCMADTVIRGDIRGPISVNIKGNLIVQGAIECKKVEVSGTIKADLIKTEAKVGETIHIAIASNAILQSETNIHISREFVHSKINSEYLIVKQDGTQEVLCAYLEITADKVEMDGVSIRNIVEINLGANKFKEIQLLKDKTAKIIASLSEIIKEIREKTILLLEKIKSTINERNDPEKKIIKLLLDILVGMIKGYLPALKTKEGIEDWIRINGHQFYAIVKQATQLLPLLEGYNSYQMEFQTLSLSEERISETLQSIKIDIKGSILTTGLIVIRCNDEELKFGCRPQSPKDKIDISLVYVPKKGLRPSDMS